MMMLNQVNHLLLLLPPPKESIVRLHIGCHDAEPRTFGEINRILRLSRKPCLQV
jgi:DNA-directed RNA polymerase sigma subunit (sigma70/sigma32)